MIDPLAQPNSPIIDVEWTRVHSGTLDGVFYDDLYWGGIRRSSPTLVDIDGDGDLDLFVHGWNRLSGDHDELHFFRNDGSATAPSWTHVTENYFGQYKRPVRFVDLDGDGDLDAVLNGWTWEPEGFIYYENTGSASEPAWALRTTDMLGNGRSGEGDGGFALADIDNDGDADLFFITTWQEDEDWFTSIAFYENTGSPTAPAWTFVTDTYADITCEEYVSIAFADIDDDGDLDLFLGQTNRITHYRNDGTANAPVWTFVTDTYGGIGLPYGWAVMHFVLTFGDLDGSGTLDLVVGQPLGWLTSFKNTGTPANASWTLWVDGMLSMDYGLFTNPALADIDNDGDLDLFLGSANGLNNAHFVFLRNDGTPATPLWTYVTGDYGGTDPYIGLKHPTFVDIDGDGDLDLFFGTGPFFSWDDGTLHFYENIGTPEIAEFAFITDTYLSIVGPSAVVAPAFADIDGDGDYDLFVAISGQIHYYRNDGDATLPVWTYVTDNYMGIAASAMAFTNVDGDGDLDLFTDRAFYRNDGDAANPAWAPATTPQGLAWSGGPPALGDLLGDDGRPDLLLGGNGGVYLYRNLTPAPPVVDFSGSPTSGVVPLQVQFTDESTGTPTGWAWYFGDEEFSEPWVQQTTSAAWTGRWVHTSVALPDGSIVLMGGYDYNRRNDVWRSTDQGATWTQMTASAEWSGRNAHASVVLPDGSIVLMGGYSGVIGLNDVWRSTDQGATWTQMTASAEWVRRYAHASVVLSDGSIVLMGGGGGTGYNDVWRSTDQGATWVQMTASANWPGRAGHASVALPDGSIVLMGGEGSVRFNDVWRSTDQGATWTQMSANAEWSPRYGFGSVVLADGTVVLMGGSDGYTLWNDVWRSTDQGAAWAQITASADWTGRTGHTSVTLPDGRIVLMGGYTPTPSNDAWRWETAGSYEQHPSHTYTEPGIYTVALQAYHSAGYGSTLKAAYITVRSACPMDMDGDGQVTVLDIQDVASRWLAEAAGGPPYDIRFDVAPPGAPDGVINIADIQTIAAAFMSCPINP